MLLTTHATTTMTQTKIHELPHNASVAKQTHRDEKTPMLIDKWDLYYHLPHDKKWNLESYCKIMGDIDILEKINALNEQMTEPVVQNYMLFVMRGGITPMYEDPKNRDGGYFSFKIINKHIGSLWNSLFSLMGEEKIFVNKKHNSYVSGMTVSPKKNFCILKIWMQNCLVQDPELIVSLPNLDKTGCFFAKHKPEF